eukprot:350069-Chlamydomonas_euryale.AAC.2
MHVPVAGLQVQSSRVLVSDRDSANQKPRPDAAAVQMKRSMVVGKNDTGVMDDVRTSAGMFLPRNQVRPCHATKCGLATQPNAALPRNQVRPCVWPLGGLAGGEGRTGLPVHF